MYLKTIFTILIIVCAFLIVPKAKAFTATGTAESAIRDIGTGATWKEMVWTASTTASSTITLKVRTGTTSDMVSATAWDSCLNVTNGADISANSCVHDGERFVQYYALLSCDYATTSEFVSPELLDVEIRYGAVGFLYSSAFDSLAADTVLSAVRWNETKPGGSDVLVQLRTSADEASWTAWQGPGGSEASYFTDPSGGEALPPLLRDGSGERYFQYRSLLLSGGTDLPVLSDITLDFQAIEPAISTVSPGFAGSNASGTLAIQISGSNFFYGATVAVESGGVSFAMSGVVVSADTINFNLDTALLSGGPARIVVTNPNNTSAIWNNFYVNEYVGTYVSLARELPNLSFGSLTWTAVATSATASVGLKIRTSGTSDMSGALPWTACPWVASGTDISALSGVADGARYIQYKAEFRILYATTTGYYSPELLDVNLDYDRIAATGTLVSSPFDSGTEANAWRLLTWTESVPAGTDISFQIRTAPDASGAPGTWSEWKGPYESDGWYGHADGAGGINISHNDGVADRWSQYSIRLESSGASSPVLSDLNLEYGDKSYSVEIIKDNTIFKDGTGFR